MERQGQFLWSLTPTLPSESLPVNPERRRPRICSPTIPGAAGHGSQAHAQRPGRSPEDLNRRRPLRHAAELGATHDSASCSRIISLSGLQMGCYKRIQS
jgi:hypothetical protein